MSTGKANIDVHRHLLKDRANFHIRFALLLNSAANASLICPTEAVAVSYQDTYKTGEVFVH